MDPRRVRPPIAALRKDPTAVVSILAAVFGPNAAALASDASQVGPGPADAALMQDDAIRE
jgi:hypothetical protein